MDPPQNIASSTCQRNSTHSKSKKPLTPPKKRPRYDEIPKGTPNRKAEAKYDRITSDDDSGKIANSDHSKKRVRKVEVKLAGKKCRQMNLNQVNYLEALSEHSETETERNSTSGYLGAMENNSTSACEQEVPALPIHYSSPRESDTGDVQMRSARACPQGVQQPDNSAEQNLRIPALVKYFVRNHMHKDCHITDPVRRNLRTVCRCLGNPALARCLFPSTSSQAPVSTLIAQTAFATDNDPSFRTSFRANIPSEIASLVRLAATHLRHLCRKRASGMTDKQDLNETGCNNVQNTPG